MPDALWHCPTCDSEQTHESACEQCGAQRFQTRAVQIARHILEHFADGIVEPIDMLEAMNARTCYANVRGGFQLQFIASQMRLLTRDTSHFARALLKAKADIMALNVIEHGDTKDHIAALKGIQVLGEVVEHKGDLVTRHVVELHEGPPPKR